MDWIKVINFVLFLFIAAYQDLKSKSIAVWVYWLFGGLAMLILWRDLYNLMISSQLVHHWWEIPGGMAIGLCLLGLGRITGGAVGEGDGWFFFISGVYLGFWDNMKLLIYGGLLCSVWCLWVLAGGVISGRNIRKTTLPFLPFLVPVGLWIVFI